MNVPPYALPLSWDLVAGAYANDLIPMSERYSVEALRRAQVPSGGAIVDVATGPGSLAVLAARAGHPVSAIDFSVQMIGELRRRIDAEGLKNVDACIGDGMQLPYADGVFQAGFSMFGLMFFPDRARGFRELHRVLADGARAVVSSFPPLDRVPLYALALATLQQQLPPPPPGTPPPVMPLGRPHECVAEMTAAGFREVEVIEVANDSAAPSMKEMWAHLARTQVPFALAKKNLGEGWDRVSRVIEERLASAFGEGPQTVQRPAYLTVGVKSV
jgi:SAM-dependent methyltransferase